MDISFNTPPSDIGQIVAGVLIAIAAYVFSKIRKFAKTASCFNKPEINYNLRIIDLLKEIRLTTRSDRVYLFQIHNGDYYQTGESMRKLSLSHFDNRAEISIPLHGESYYHNIPVGYLADTFSSLIDKNFIFLPKVDSCKEYYLKALLRMAGNESAVVCCIPGPRGIVGLLVLAWIDDIQEMELSSDEIISSCNQLSAELVLKK